MQDRRPDRWLRRLRGTATFVHVAALCLSVAVLVIGVVPGSPVSLQLPADVLSGVGPVRAVGPRAVIDQDGFVAFSMVDPSLGQRLLLVATMLPGLMLLGEVARRIGRLLRFVETSDPFSARTVRDLMTVAKLTAAGGLAVWGIGLTARWVLSTTVLDSGAAVQVDRSLLGWFAVALVFAAFAQVIGRGVVMRAELDTVI